MNKLFLTLAFFFYVLTIKCGNIPQTHQTDDKLISSNWRNVRTGAWEISFLEDCAIYDAQFWKYKGNIKKGNPNKLVLSNGKKDLVVLIGKQKNGIRKITIDKGEPALCEPLTTRYLPDYPIKDETPLADVGYNKMDTAVVVGWLRNMPRKEWDKGREFDVTVPGILDDEDSFYSCKMDSTGRFSIKIPLLNSCQAFLDWKRSSIESVLEPGRTYFIYHDFKTGDKWIMGKDARLQNEILASITVEPFAGKRDNEDADVFLERTIKQKAHIEKGYETYLQQHPNLSAKFKEYFQKNLQIREAFTLGQSSYASPGFQLAQNIKDYLYNHHWKQPVKPYILTDLYETFFHDFIRSFKPFASETDIREAVKLYQIELTDEEKETLKKMDVAQEELIKLLGKATTDEERAEIYKQNKMKYADVWKAFTKLYQAYKQQTITTFYFNKIKNDRHILDSLGCDESLRSLFLARQYYQAINTSCHSLSDFLLQTLDKDVQLPILKELVLQAHNKYVNLETGQPTHSQSIQSNQNVANINDGEALLRKITEPYRGHYILLDVWGTWCRPCKAALAHAHELYEALAPYDMIYLYLATHSPEDSWKNVIKEYKLTGDNCVHYNLPQNQQAAIESFLKVKSFPTYKLIDPEGNVLDVNADARNIESIKNLMKTLKER